MKNRALFRTLIFLLACLLFCCGCGKKGPVKPLRQPFPAAPEHLTALQQGDLMQLSWQLPEQNQDGSELNDLQGFHIYKMSYDPTDQCPECRDLSVLMRQIDLDFLQNAERQDNRLTIWDDDLEAGFGYQYRVVAVTQQRREGAAAVTRQTFLPPVAAPVAVQASGYDRMVRLSWQPPELVNGERILGYTLYRHTLGELAPSFPTIGQLVQDTSYEDYGLTNGITYVYRVRMVVDVRGVRQESAASPPVEVVPEAGK
ncbi:MAG: fibronectin type III domain-containing protein [Desulfuromonadaceae bacterium]